MDEQEGKITKQELTSEELDVVSGGLTNGQTELYHAFIGGLVKGYMDAGGHISIGFH
jgi:hypothetical protein